MQVEGTVGRRLLDHKRRPRKPGVHLGQLLLVDIREDLQLLFSLSKADPRRDRGAQSLAPAGVRDDHAFHILDDIPADRQHHTLRHYAERLSGKRARIGDRDRFRAAHGLHQLFVQDIQIGTIYSLIHARRPSLWFLISLYSVSRVRSISFPSHPGGFML